MDDAAFEGLRERAPLAVFEEWFERARATEAINPEAVTLATVDAAGMPQVRTVLLKDFSNAGFVFYTNRDSRKGEALRQQPRAAMLFYWRALGRQVSIEGAVREFSSAQTRAYFDSRPHASRVAAIASRQSRVLESLAVFEAAVAACERQYENAAPPLPDDWRGFALLPARMEFWAEGKFRRHRRMVFVRGDDGTWGRGALLYP